MHENTCVILNCSITNILKKTDDCSILCDKGDVRGNVVCNEVKISLKCYIYADTMANIFVITLFYNKSFNNFTRYL